MEVLSDKNKKREEGKENSNLPFVLKFKNDVQTLTTVWRVL